MTKLLSFVGPHGAPVNLELPEDAPVDHVVKLVTGTPPGGGWYLTVLVDGKETRVHVRPDTFGMFFIHEK